MKIEKIILQRDAACRGPGQTQYHEHGIDRGQAALKISEFQAAGNSITFFICKHHSDMVLKILEDILKDWK
jgi:hypothetical protein